MSHPVRTIAVVLGVAAVALVITAWSTRPQESLSPGVRPLLASSFEGPPAWGFQSAVGTVATTDRWSHIGTRSLFANAVGSSPAYVTSSLPGKALWGRFWLRVQHRPAAGATVVMAVTGDGSGMFLKLQADGRVALVLGGGQVAGRSAAPLAPGVPYLIGWTWPKPMVKLVSEHGLPLARLWGPAQSAAATRLKLGIADRNPTRRAVEIDSVEVWPG